MMKKGVSKKLLVLVMAFAILFTIPLTVSADESETDKMQSNGVGTANKVTSSGSCIFANGMPIVIDEDEDGITNIYSTNNELLVTNVSDKWIFGGSKNGELKSDTSIIINGGTLNNNVYGGNCAGTLTGNVSITINGGKVNRVYGGSEGNSTEPAHVVGDISIIMNTGSNVKTIYGGGWSAGTCGNVDIKLLGDTVDFVFGGAGDYGSVKSSKVVLNGTTVMQSVYGGGCGNNATVEGNTYVEMNRGTVTYSIYGGGEKLSEVKGTANVIVNGGTVQEVVGGGRSYENSASTVANTYVKIGKNTTVTEVLAGGLMTNSTVTGNAVAELEGTVQGGVFTSRGGTCNNVKFIFRGEENKNGYVISTNGWGDEGSVTGTKEVEFIGVGSADSYISISGTDMDTLSFQDCYVELSPNFTISDKTTSIKFNNSSVICKYGADQVNGNSWSFPTVISENNSKLYIRVKDISRGIEFTSDITGQLSIGILDGTGNDECTEGDLDRYATNGTAIVTTKSDVSEDALNLILPYGVTGYSLVSEVVGEKRVWKIKKHGHSCQMDGKPALVEKILRIKAGTGKAEIDLQAQGVTWVENECTQEHSAEKISYRYMLVGGNNEDASISETKMTVTKPGKYNVSVYAFGNGMQTESSNEEITVIKEAECTISELRYNKQYPDTSIVTFPVTANDFILNSVMLDDKTLNKDSQYTVQDNGDGTFTVELNKDMLVFSETKQMTLKLNLTSEGVDESQIIEVPFEITGKDVVQLSIQADKEGKITYGDTVSYTVNLTKGEGVVNADLPAGDISLYMEKIDEEHLVGTKAITNQSCTFQLTPSELSAGSHKLIVVYSGNDKYMKKQCQQDISIEKAKLIITPENMYNYEGARINYTVNLKYDGFVNGEDQNVLKSKNNNGFYTLVDNVGYLTVPGEYDIEVKGSSENTNYEYIKNTSKFTVRPFDESKAKSIEVNGEEYWLYIHEELLEQESSKLQEDKQNTGVFVGYPEERIKVLNIELIRKSDMLFQKVIVNKISVKIPYEMLEEVTEKSEYYTILYSNCWSGARSEIVDKNSILQEDDGLVLNTNYFGVYAIGTSGTAVEGIQLDKESIYLKCGETADITAEIMPNDATNQKILWDNSNPHTVKFDLNGKIGTITAKQEGTSTITVVTEDGRKSKSCRVVVYRNPDVLQGKHGQTLEDIEDKLPEGYTFEEDLKTVLNIGTHTFHVTYTPKESEIYGKVEGIEVNIEVTKAEIPTGLTAVYGSKLSDIKLPLGFTWEGNASIEVGNVGENTFYVTYTPGESYGVETHLHRI